MKRFTTKATALNAAALGLLLLAITLPARGKEKAALKLEEAITIAVQAHPSVIGAKAALMAAKAKPGQVSAWDDPVFTLMTGIPFNTPLDPPLMDMKITQKFPLSPVYSYKKQAALAQAEAASTKIPAAQLDVSMAVALAYYEIVFLEELRDVVEKELELAANIVEATALRFSSLSGNQADIIRAQISRDEIETSLEVVKLDIRAARQVLVLLLRDERDPDSFSVLTPGYPAVTLGMDELTRLAVAQRPELAYFDSKAVEYAKQEKAAKAGYAPQLAVSAGYQYKSDTLAGLMGQDAFALGFAINLPIQAKKHKSAVEESKALGIANEASKSGAILTIEMRLVEIRFALKSMEEKIALQEDKVIPKARAALDLTLAAYAAQNAGITDVLTAFEKFLAADRKRSMLRGMYFASYALLQREIGTFSKPL
ncbi:MAG: TolC family protein [Pseudomonadota bacterium]